MKYVRKLIIPSLAIVLSLAAEADSAQACFGCWIWGSAPDSGLQAESWTVHNGGAEIPVLPLEIVKPYGIRELDIRRAFDIAYFKQNFVSASAKTEAYTRWKSTIGVAETNFEDTKSYNYRCPECAQSNVMMGSIRRGHIEANLFSQGLLSFDIAAPHYGEILGQRLGLKRESGAGLFARMFVAFGGENAVKRVKANWVMGSSNYETFLEQLKVLKDPVGAANATFTGKMLDRFYGMSAGKIYELDKGVSYIAMFAPSRQQMNLNWVSQDSAVDDIKEDNIPPIPEDDIPPIPNDDEETVNAHHSDHGHQADDTIDIE